MVTHTLATGVRDSELNFSRVRTFYSHFYVLGSIFMQSKLWFFKVQNRGSLKITFHILLAVAKCGKIDLNFVCFSDHTWEVPGSAGRGRTRSTVE